jgi:hypothetical protein
LVGGWSKRGVRFIPVLGIKPRQKRKAFGKASELNQRTAEAIAQSMNEEESAGGKNIGIYGPGNVWSISSNEHPDTWCVLDLHDLRLRPEGIKSPRVEFVQEHTWKNRRLYDRSLGCQRWISDLFACTCGAFITGEQIDAASNEDNFGLTKECWTGWCVFSGIEEDSQSYPGAPVVPVRERTSKVLPTRHFEVQFDKTNMGPVVGPVVQNNGNGNTAIGVDQSALRAATKQFDLRARAAKQFTDKLFTDKGKLLNTQAVGGGHVESCSSMQHVEGQNAQEKAYLDRIAALEAKLAAKLEALEKQDQQIALLKAQLKETKSPVEAGLGLIPKGITASITDHNSLGLIPKGITAATADNNTAIGYNALLVQTANVDLFLSTAIKALEEKKALGEKAVEDVAPIKAIHCGADVQYVDVKAVKVGLVEPPTVEEILVAYACAQNRDPKERNMLGQANTLSYNGSGEWVLFLRDGFEVPFNEVRQLWTDHVSARVKASEKDKQIRVYCQGDHPFDEEL